MSTKQCWHVVVRPNGNVLRLRCAMHDPFTGESYHESAVMAAIVMLGGSVADHLTYVGRAA